MRDDHPLIRILEIILALALLGSLVFAGWRIFRSLPASQTVKVQLNQAAANSELTIVWRDGLSDSDARVELYPIDIATLERDFRINGRPGKSIDDYLGQRLKNLTPVQVSVNQNGRAVARLSEGNWWMRATTVSANGEAMEWRVQIVISQPAHTIELSKDNVYERTKKF